MWQRWPYRYWLALLVQIRANCAGATIRCSIASAAKAEACGEAYYVRITMYDYMTDLQESAGCKFRTFEHLPVMHKLCRNFLDALCSIDCELCLIHD